MESWSRRWPRQADSARLDIVARQARDLKARYKTHEKLLDEALYPQTFASAFQRIDAGLASRRQETADREKMITREQVLAGELAKKTRENEKLQARARADDATRGQAFPGKANPCALESIP